ncbi:MAG: NAD(P)/FAD-dependent oxidoreductase [Chitinophagaceae bacterium]|nr:NAD(P)/FAD-dependent oxidoreductase [Chitinophagaceae bacterium]
MKQNNIKVVVVGGGFAGLNLVKKLSKNKSFQITLVDHNNYHYFPPLLYQVASAFIEPSNISYPFRRMFHTKKNLRFHMGSLVNVDLENKIVETSNDNLRYDYLVLAMGTRSNYFGMRNVQEHAWPMKTINDALNLRNHILLSMEKAVRATTKEERKRALNIVVAGGGPTGVEISGMIAELGHNVARREYPEIKNFQGHIHLVDMAPVLLGTMSKKAQKMASSVLSKLGVKIMCNVAVKDYRDGIVYLSDGKEITTDTLIWTSGVVANDIPGLPDDITGRGKRIQVNEFNEVKNIPGVFAIGDISIQTTDGNFPKGHPQLAQVAIQQGKLLAKNLARKSSGMEMIPFAYNDKGSMAIVSKYKAVADLHRFSLTGYFAWVIWLFIHIIPLIGYRNKAKLAFNWFWSFITNNPTLRLIIRPGKVVDENDEKHTEERLGSFA